MARILRGEVRPAQALARPPMLLNILHQNTSAEPLRSIMAEAAAMEAEPGVLAASVAGGYQYADVWEVGPSAVVVTDNDPAKARQLADRLAQGAPGWVMTLADPAAVQECVRAGVGRPVSLVVGGKTDTLHGAPVAVSGRVRSLHEGTYEDAERRHGGQRRYDQGLTAVVAVGARDEG